MRRRARHRAAAAQRILRQCASSAMLRLTTETHAPLSFSDHTAQCRRCACVLLPHVTRARLGGELDAERKRAAAAEGALAALQRGAGAAQEARLRTLKAEASSALRAAGAPPAPGAPQATSADAQQEAPSAALRAVRFLVVCFPAHPPHRSRTHARCSVAHTHACMLTPRPARASFVSAQELSAARTAAVAAAAEAARLSDALAAERAARLAAEDELLRVYAAASAAQKAQQQQGGR